jgi:hypothetical protein
MTAIARRRLFLPSLAAVLGLLGAVLATGAFVPRASQPAAVAAAVSKWMGTR